MVVSQMHSFYKPVHGIASLQLNNKPITLYLGGGRGGALSDGQEEVG